MSILYINIGIIELMSPLKGWLKNGELHPDLMLCNYKQGSCQVIPWVSTT